MSKLTPQNHDWHLVNTQTMVILQFQPDPYPLLELAHDYNDACGQTDRYRVLSDEQSFKLGFSEPSPEA
jgi:hypothetical protein